MQAADTGAAAEILALVRGVGIAGFESPALVTAPTDKPVAEVDQAAQVLALVRGVGIVGFKGNGRGSADDVQP